MESPAMDAATPDDRALAALRTVLDPEVGLNIVDLGLIVGLDWREPEGLMVRMTMTSAACPMSEAIMENALAALDLALPDLPPAEIALVWEPAWSPERMSAAARAQFGWLKPPHG